MFIIWDMENMPCYEGLKKLNLLSRVKSKSVGSDLGNYKISLPGNQVEAIIKSRLKFIWKVAICEGLSSKVSEKERGSARVMLYSQRSRNYARQGFLRVIALIGPTM